MRSVSVDVDVDVDGSILYSNGDRVRVCDFDGCALERGDPIHQSSIIIIIIVIVIIVIIIQ